MPVTDVIVISVMTNTKMLSIFSLPMFHFFSLPSPLLPFSKHSDLLQVTWIIQPATPTTRCLRHTSRSRVTNYKSCPARFATSFSRSFVNSVRYFLLISFSFPLFSFRFVSFRFVPFRSVAFRFVAFRSVSFRFVSSSNYLCSGALSFPRHRLLP